MKRNNKNINMFMNHINNKVPFRCFIRWIINNFRVYVFRKSILNGSPSFNVLWQMADFIKLSELVFFYNNSVDSNIYSSNNYTAGQNGFIIKDKAAKIIVKLYSDKEQVVLDIYRILGSHNKTIMTFTKDEWDNNPTIYDEMLLNYAIKIINSNIIYLFDKYYYKM